MTARGIGLPAPRSAPAPVAAANRRIIEAADAARQELARDLHDGVQQQLVVCLAQLQRAQHKWSRDPGMAKALLDEGIEEATGALVALRELAVGIHPHLLTHHGLRAAVDDLASRQPLPVSIEATGERFSPAFEASVFYCVSEAMTNVVKHARASRAEIAVLLDGDRLTIEVTDNGVGGARETDTGSGLHGLADRVTALGGSLAIASEPGSGTSLHAELPVIEPGSD